MPSRVLSRKTSPNTSRSNVPRLAPVCVLGLVAVRCDAAPEPRSRGSGQAPSCAAADFVISRPPLDGENGRDWLIINYVDLDGRAGAIADYTGRAGDEARTYDGHRGLDIDVPSFRAMDADRAVIHAVAPGVVERVIQDQPDRHTSCAGTWNVVRVRHANGFLVSYGHIKRGSARVAAGELVRAGAPLAIVGSAGCSAEPHLHLEVESCDGAPVETLREAGAWPNPPAYDPPPAIMDVVLRAGTVPTVARIKDPAPDARTVEPDSTLGVGLSAAVRGGDVLTVTLAGPTGARSEDSVLIEGPARLGHYYPRFALPIGPALGTWTIDVAIDGRPATTRAIQVAPPAEALSRAGSSGEVPRHRARAQKCRSRDAWLRRGSCTASGR